MKMVPVEEEVARIGGCVITSDRVIVPAAPATHEGADGGQRQSWWYVDFRTVTIGREHRTRFLGGKVCVARIELADPERLVELRFKSQLAADYFFALLYGALCRRGLTCQIGYSREAFDWIET